MNLKFQNDGQFKLNPIPPWKRDGGTAQSQNAKNLAKLAKSISKPNAEFRCMVLGKAITAPTKPDLERRVGEAVKMHLGRYFPLK